MLEEQFVSVTDSSFETLIHDHSHLRRFKGDCFSDNLDDYSMDRHTDKAGDIFMISLQKIQGWSFQ